MKQRKHLHRQILQEGEIIYLSLSDLAAALGFAIDYNPITFEAVLTSRDDRMNLNLFSEYVLLNDNLRNIVYPIIYRQADFYLCWYEAYCAGV